MQVPTETTVPQLSALPGTRQLPCTGIWKPILLIMKWYIQMSRQQEHTVDMALPRVFMQWNPLSMSWRTK